MRGLARPITHLALTAVIVLAALSHAAARDALPGGILTYRDFKVDMSAVADAPNREALEESIKKQIDIIADSGVKPEIMAFFRAQTLTMTEGKGSHGGGRYSKATGVQIEARALPPERPIVLHELLHALHAHYLPSGVDNPDIIKFYGNARRAMLYPPGAYVLVNKGEFFAITGSLYLWGFVARPPNNRETLRAKQPYYYEWLGQTFGVKK